MDPDVGRGLARRNSAIDYLESGGVLADGLPDQAVLELAAGLGRILVTRDVRTMPSHFREFTALRKSPGMILVSRNRTTGDAIEGLLTYWLACTGDDVQNQLLWLP